MNTNFTSNKRASSKHGRRNAPVSERAVGNRAHYSTRAETFRYNAWKAFSLAVLFVTVGASARGAKIHGTVFDPAGRPVPGIQVTLVKGPIPVVQAKTGAHGQFQFNRLAAGEYEVVASGPGLSARRMKVRLATDRAIAKVTLRLALSAVRQRVIVSASLGGSLASQVGSSVSVISHRQLLDQNSQNLFQALRNVPGVTVSQAGRWGGVTGLFVRGGNSNYNLVMIDGVEVNEFGGDFDFASLPADGVARVEVVRDPESALYGPDAVSSVVNIISRRGEGKLHFDGTEEMGSYNTWRISTGAGGLTHGVNWDFDLSRLDSNGVVRNDNYRDQSSFLTLGFDTNPRRQVDLHFFGNANDAGAPGPYGSDPDHLFTGIDTVSRDKQNLFAIGGSETEEFSPRFRQVTSLGLAVNNYYFKSPFGDSYSDNLRGSARSVSAISLSSRDFLAAGVEWNREQIHDTYIADVNGKPFVLPRAAYGEFLENRWTPTSRIFLNAGVRLDEIHTAALPAGGFGVRPSLAATTVTQASPRVSFAYLVRHAHGAGAIGLTRIHSSFGTGIRPPDGFELAFTNNGHLKPERNLGFDVGVEQRLFNDKMDLDATSFYNRFEDQIVVLGGSLTNLSSFISANLGNSKAEGTEFSASYHPVQSLSVSGNYTLLSTAVLALDGANQALAPFHVGQPLIRRPKNSGSFDVTWAHRRLTLNANAYWRGSTLDTEPNYGLGACLLTDANGNPLPCLFTNKGYALVNTGFAYEFTPGIQFYGRLNNALNQKYEDVFGYPALKLNFMAGLHFTFPPKL